MNFQALIQEAENLKTLSYQSSAIDLYQKRIGKIILQEYGQEYYDLFDNLFYAGAHIAFDDSVHQRDYIKKVDSIIDFLQNLQKEENSETILLSPSLSSLNIEIQKRCSSLYDKGEFSEAVEKGFKVVRDKLRELTTYETGSEAFGKGYLHIKGAAATNVDADFNQGVKFLTMAIDMFRNEKSHTSIAYITNPKKAYEYLSLSSLAMNLLDNAEIIKKE